MNTLLKKSLAMLALMLLCVFTNSIALAQAIGNRSVNTPNNNNRLQIERATYGYNGKGNDVTNRVRANIRDNRINMEVNNDTMGGDPNEGKKKNLKVVYTYGNKRQTKTVNEHDTLRIP